MKERIVGYRGGSGRSSYIVGVIEGGEWEDERNGNGDAWKGNGDGDGMQG